MIDPAHMPIVLAQVSELTGAAKGLQEGGAYFIAAVVGAIAFALFRENRQLREQLLSEVKAANESKMALVKEVLPIADKLADAIPAVERIVDKLTRE